MGWQKEGVNYWDNPDCPRGYLENELIKLIEYVEGTELPDDYFSNTSRDLIQRQIAFYEDIADK